MGRGDQTLEYVTIHQSALSQLDTPILPRPHALPPPFFLPFTEPRSESEEFPSLITAELLRQVLRADSSDVPAQVAGAPEGAVRIVVDQSEGVWSVRLGEAGVGRVQEVR